MGCRRAALGAETVAETFDSTVVPQDIAAVSKERAIVTGGLLTYGGISAISRVPRRSVIAWLRRPRIHGTSRCCEKWPRLGGIWQTKRRKENALAVC